MANKKLFEFDVDEVMDIFVLIKSADARLAKNGKRFLSITFEDDSGELAGMYWDAKDEDVALFAPGKVVKLNAKRENYQGKPQVRIIGLRLAKETEPHDPSYFFCPMLLKNGRKLKSKLISLFLKLPNLLGIELSAI